MTLEIQVLDWEMVNASSRGKGHISRMSILLLQLQGHISKPVNRIEKVIQNRTPGTLKIKSVVPCLSHHIWNELNCKNMSFFLNISTFMDIKLLHPVQSDFLNIISCCFDTVLKTVNYIFFIIDIQCFIQRESECGSWSKIVGCFVVVTFSFISVLKH